MTAAKVVPMDPFLGPHPAALEELAQAVRTGRVLVFPTDTVYGIGANGLDPAATERLYAIKGRDSRKSLPILVHSAEEAWRWVEPTGAAKALASRFWPGPLTLVLTPTEGGRALTTGGARTLAVRVPGPPGIRRLIEASGVPWSSTSANLSGRAAAADGSAAAGAFSALADYVIDGGPAGGRESSVVDAAAEPPRILREGALSREEIFGALNTR